MRKFLNIITGLLILFVVGVIYWSFANTEKQVDFPQVNTARIEKTNLWKLLFRDAVEHAYILFPDGTLYHITSYEEHKISLTADYLIEVLKGDKHPINDAVLVIHNHWAYPMFSLTDVRFYHAITNKGFQGHFLLYVLPMGDVKEMGK